MPLVADDQCIDLLPGSQFYAAHSTSGASHGPHVVLVETNGLARTGKKHNLTLAIGDGNINQTITFNNFEGNLAVRTRSGKFAERCLFHQAGTGRHENEAVLGKFTNRQNRIDALIFFQWQQVHDGFTACITAGLRQVIDL